MKPITILITGVGGGGLGEQILKALRMATTPYKIVGGDMDPLSMGLQFVDYPYFLPPAVDSSYIGAIDCLCKRHGVKALFPGSEPELKIISRNRDQLQGNGVLIPLNPHQVIETCLDKIRTMTFLKSHEFSHPRFMQITSAADLEKVSFLPAVLKPSVGSGGSTNTFIVQSKNELDLFGNYLLNLTDRFICQEYVGLATEEYTVGVLLGLDGKLINSIAIRRNLGPGLSCRIKVPNRTGRKELGPTLIISSGISQGEIGVFPQVTRDCERLALELGCTGAVNIQCRLVNGRPCIFEINPRFSGTTSLRAMVGYNEPDLLIRQHLLNEKAPRGFAYKGGFICRGLQESLFIQTPAPVMLDGEEAEC
jgi:carbamoyl-phosphate synthase large subunit